MIQRCAKHDMPLYAGSCAKCAQATLAANPLKGCGTCGGVGEVEGGRGEAPRVDCPECTPRRAPNAAALSGSIPCSYCHGTGDNKSCWYCRGTGYKIHLRVGDTQEGVK